jgi:hypothetical protein
MDNNVLIVGGAVAVLGFAVYELLKPTNVTPQSTSTQATNPQTNPQAANNPVVLYTPTIAPSNAQSASVGSGSYYAINYSPVSTYAPYNYSYSSVNKTSSTTYSSQYSPQTTYTASGLASSVYGSGAKTATQQPSLLNFGGGATI